MRAFALVLVMMAACAKEAPKTSAFVARFTELKDRLCACKDTACAGALEPEFLSFSKDFEAARSNGATDEATTKKVDEIATAYQACMGTLLKAP